MKNLKLFYIVLLVLPWLTVPLLGRNSLKKYLPAALFMCTFTKALDQFGEKKKWWRFYKGVPPLDSMNFFNLGSYLVTCLWRLKLTYGNYPLYLITGTIFHICFIFFGGLKLLDRYKIGTLVKLTKFQYLFIDFLRALLLYVFQLLIDLSRSNYRQKKT